MSGLTGDVSVARVIAAMTARILFIDSRETDTLTIGEDLHIKQ